jgi:pimeloyl-ACP methyl ester carboxylesterase
MPYPTAQQGSRDKAIARPVLLYWGYNDPISPFGQGLRLYELIGDKQHRTQFHAVNEAGHYPFRERPEEFDRVIAAFAEGASHGE